MTPARWQQVKEVFDQAVECDLASRMAYVRGRCGDDEELRREVESLLASDTQTRSLLDNPLMETGTDVPTFSHAAEASPVENDSFGPYAPVRVLGEGGMGTVYLAQQQRPIRRDVALKVVKLGMDSRQVLERFEIERQALALMDHPNVARVLDAGTSERGRPYFVMEYVEGVPITQYCDGKTLSTRERLQLFIPVCNALQHAHKKGIIHRDVKPSNVLVTEVDGKPLPKVIDFGVARATEQHSVEGEAFTLSGQLIGTPEYMSPEQASMDSRSVDTGTDVYSLGVVLYELLVGMLPLDIKSLRKIAFGELLRAIRDTPVPKPTARITQMGGAADELALKRSTSPGHLKRELAGDLDSIVMKAIDKDRNCRYASASEFATDIGRYLRNESVLASPPGVMYRTRKFVRRNRAAVFVFLVLIAGLATSIWQAMRVRLAEQQTQRIGALVLGPDPSDRNFTDVRSFAQAMFYTMKSMQVRIAKFEKMAESGNAQAAEQAINLRSQHKTLDDNYNRLLASLKMYGPKMTEEQKLVLRVTRIFGESELDMPKDFFAEVQKYIQLWKAKGRYLEYVRRAQQKGYAGGIAREFTSQGLPQQFFYLAMMESGFNEDAVGPKTSMGYAKGMWQFVPRTATEYGLKLGPLVASQRVDPLDDRHHWGRETKAAAAYIRNLYGTEAQGSGFLVMACYNSVSSLSVLPVLRHINDNPRDRNFWKLLELYRTKVPYETYAYVLLIVSAAVIGENPRLFGIDCDNPLSALPENSEK